jgi:hypothetical protein
MVIKISQGTVAGQAQPDDMDMDDVPSLNSKPPVEPPKPKPAGKGTTRSPVTVLAQAENKAPAPVKFDKIDSDEEIPHEAGDASSSSSSSESDNEGEDEKDEKKVETEDEEEFAPPPPTTTKEPPRPRIATIVPEPRKPDEPIAQPPKPIVAAAAAAAPPPPPQKSSLKQTTITTSARPPPPKKVNVVAPASPPPKKPEAKKPEPKKAEPPKPPPKKAAPPPPPPAARSSTKRKASRLVDDQAGADEEDEEEDEEEDDDYDEDEEEEDAGDGEEDEEEEPPVDGEQDAEEDLDGSIALDELGASDEDEMDVDDAPAAPKEKPKAKPRSRKRAPAKPAVEEEEEEVSDEMVEHEPTLLEEMNVPEDATEEEVIDAISNTKLVRKTVTSFIKLLVGNMCMSPIFAHDQRSAEWLAKLKFDDSAMDWFLEHLERTASILGRRMRSSHVVTDYSTVNILHMQMLVDSLENEQGGTSNQTLQLLQNLIKDHVYDGMVQYFPSDFPIHPDAAEISSWMKWMFENIQILYTIRSTGNEKANPMYDLNIVLPDYDTYVVLLTYLGRVSSRMRNMISILLASYNEFFWNFRCYRYDYFPKNRQAFVNALAPKLKKDYTKEQVQAFTDDELAKHGYDKKKTQDAIAEQFKEEFPRVILKFLDLSRILTDPNGFSNGKGSLGKLIYLRDQIKMKGEDQVRKDLVTWGEARIQEIFNPKKKKKTEDSTPRCAAFDDFVKYKQYFLWIMKKNKNMTSEDKMKLTATDPILRILAWSIVLKMGPMVSKKNNLLAKPTSTSTPTPAPITSAPKTKKQKTTK